MLSHDEKPQPGAEAEAVKPPHQNTWAERELDLIVMSVGMDAEAIALKVAIFSAHQQRQLLDEIHKMGGRSLMHQVEHHLQAMQGSVPHHHHHKKEVAAGGDGDQLMAPSFGATPAAGPNPDLMTPTFDKSAASNTDLMAPGTSGPTRKSQGGADELMTPDFGDDKKDDKKLER